MRSSCSRKIDFFHDLKEHNPGLPNSRRFANNKEPTLDEIQIIFRQYLIYAFLTICNAMAKAEKKKTAKTKVSTIPKGYHSVTPVLIIKGAEQAIEFYKNAFGAKELDRAYIPGSNIILHAEMQIGDSRIMLNDEFPEMNYSLHSQWEEQVLHYTSMSKTSKRYSPKHWPQVQPLRCQ